MAPVLPPDWPSLHEREMIEIAEATLADLDYIATWSVDHEFWDRYDHSKEEFCNGMTVLRLDGRVIAYYWGWCTWFEVHPDHRGQGLGRRLAMHMLSEVRTAYPPVATVLARAEAVGFWKRLGFEVVRRPGKGRPFTEMRWPRL